MSYKNYTELDVWLKSRALANHIFKITQKFPKEELYGLVSQMRRCAVSVPSNIAEGCGRNHTKDSIQFFYTSRGSIYELETQVFLSFDQKYISEEELKLSLDLVTECKKLINGFINYYDKLSK